jgi:hypothetical protein
MTAGESSFTSMERLFRKLSKRRSRGIMDLGVYCRTEKTCRQQDGLETTNQENAWERMAGTRPW